MGLVRHRSSGGARVRAFARVSQLALSLATRLHVASYQRAWPLWSVVKRDVCTWRRTRHFSTYSNIDVMEITHSARHKTVPPRGFHEPRRSLRWSGDEVIQLQQNLMNKPQVLVQTFMFAAEGSVHLLFDCALCFGCDFRALWIKNVVNWLIILIIIISHWKRHTLKCQMYNTSFQHIILFYQIFFFFFF